MIKFSIQCICLFIFAIFSNSSIFKYFFFSQKINAKTASCSSSVNHLCHNISGFGRWKTKRKIFEYILVFRICICRIFGNKRIEFFNAEILRKNLSKQFFKHFCCRSSYKLQFFGQLTLKYQIYLFKKKWAAAFSYLQRKQMCGRGVDLVDRSVSKIAK